MIRKTKILVVDDERHIARFLEFVLKREGYDVAVAHDGDHALATVRSFRPDAMVLDVVLPKQSGLEVLKSVRSDPVHAHIKVLVLTAKSFEEGLEKMQQAGANSLCSKPIAPSVLLKTLSELGAAPKTEDTD